jgi:hypothetical protein
LVETILTLSKAIPKSNNKYKQDKNIHMLHILIDSMFALFGGWVFQLTIGIPVGTNYAPPLADLFLHAYTFKGFSVLFSIILRCRFQGECQGKKQTFECQQYQLVQAHLDR